MMGVKSDKIDTLHRRRINPVSSLIGSVSNNKAVHHSRQTASSTPGLFWLVLNRETPYCFQAVFPYCALELLELSLIVCTPPTDKY
jgi:hypothetical protein